VQPGARIKPILPGVLFATFPDTIGSIILVSHSVEEIRNGSNEVLFRLLHTDDVICYVKSWPPNRKLITAYSSVDLEEGIEVGDIVTQHSVIGRLSAPSSATTGDHFLHVSVMWTSHDVQYQNQSWDEFTSSQTVTFVEPPTPVGWPVGDFIRVCDGENSEE
jgi:hypothetical protein